MALIFVFVKEGELGVLDDAEGMEVKYMPGTPVSRCGSHLEHEVSDIALWLAASDYNEKYVRPSGHCDLMPPPDWVVTMGIWMLNVIAGGLAYESFKKVYGRVVKAFRDQRLKDAKAEFPGFSDEQIRQWVDERFELDFMKEEVQRELFRRLENFYREREGEFDWNMERMSHVEECRRNLEESGKLIKPDRELID